MLLSLFFSLSSLSLSLLPSLPLSPPSVSLCVRERTPHSVMSYTIQMNALQLDWTHSPKKPRSVSRPLCTVPFTSSPSFQNQAQAHLCLGSSQRASRQVAACQAWQQKAAPHSGRNRPKRDGPSWSCTPPSLASRHAVLPRVFLTWGVATAPASVC